MDIFDRASELEMAAREAALAAQRRPRAPRTALSHCQDCGEPIPPARQQAVPGVTRCVHCQSRAEGGHA
ncbi:MAG: TraR/DksA family transcriptional regulator [Sterolibacterium sp.]|jgi:phage/conjugal plasmid C-4 type zinc finger TraR family protein|nr:TraR/DksA family transcriptional regulator [Sterolibacterium sp.]